MPLSREPVRVGSRIARVIDLHCHPLPAVDDGPRSMQQSLAMLRAAHDAGIRTMVATPHVSAQYPRNRARDVHAGVLALRAEADAAGIEIEILAGAELELMHCEVLSDEELPGLRLGDGPFMLVELPFTATPRFAEMLLGMHHDVQPALLAHPERCRAFHDDPDLLGRLVARGMLAQVTAASIAGGYGSTVQRCAWAMLEQGLVHVIASDAHDAGGRPPLMREPLEAAGLDAIIPTLCEHNPAAILAGERPAPAPPVTPPRSVKSGRLLAGLRRR